MVFWNLSESTKEPMEHLKAVPSYREGSLALPSAMNGLGRAECWLVVAGLHRESDLLPLQGFQLSSPVLTRLDSVFSA